MSNRSQTIASNAPKVKYTINYCIKKGYFNLIPYLIKRGLDANLIDEQDQFKRNALIYCTYIKELNWALSVAQSLLEYGANLQLTDSRNLNPLHYCCAFGKDRLLSLFLKSLDFDLLDSIDKNGNTCLHYAIKFRSVKCIRLLLDKFRQYDIDIIEKKNNFGLYPTDMLSFEKQNYQSNSEMIEICKIIIECFKRPYDGDKKLSLQNTPTLMTNQQTNRPKTAPSNKHINNLNSEILFLNEFEIKLNSIPYNPLCENKEHLVEPLNSYNYDINHFISTQETKTTLKRTSTAKSHATPVFRIQSGRQSRQSLNIESVRELSIYDDDTIIEPCTNNNNISNDQELTLNKLVGWRREIQKILGNLEIMESSSYCKSIKPPLNTKVVTCLDEFFNNTNNNDSVVDKGKLNARGAKHGKQPRSAMSSMSNIGSVSRQVSASRKS